MSFLTDRDFAQVSGIHTLVRTVCRATCRGAPLDADVSTGKAAIMATVRKRFARVGIPPDGDLGWAATDAPGGPDSSGHADDAQIAVALTRLDLACRTGNNHPDGRVTA
jgi:hypothetical protein